MGCLRFKWTSNSLKKKKTGKGEEFRKGELSMQVPQELGVSYSLENPLCQRLRSCLPQKRRQAGKFRGTSVHEINRISTVRVTPHNFP